MAFCFCAGGAGYGDPLEADPEDVARDFVGGLISAWTMREIYKVAYDEVEQVVLAERDRAAADRRSARRARRATATGRRSTPRGRSSRRPRTCSSGSAPGPRASRRRRSCGCDRRHSPRRLASLRGLARRLVLARAEGSGVSVLDDALAGRPRRPSAAGAAVRGAGGGGRGARRARRSWATPAAARGSTRTSRAPCARTCWCVDSGSGWDAEAAGMDLDWSDGYPPAIGWSSACRGRRPVTRPDGRPAAPRPCGRARADAAGDDDLRSRDLRRRPRLAGRRSAGHARLRARRRRGGRGRRVRARVRAELAGRLRPRRHAAVGRAEVLPRRRRAAARRGRRSCRAGRSCRASPRQVGRAARACRARPAKPRRRRRTPRSITHTEDLAGHVPVRELQSAVGRAAMTVLWTPPPDVRDDDRDRALRGALRVRLVRGAAALVGGGPRRVLAGGLGLLRAAG